MELVTTTNIKKEIKVNFEYPESRGNDSFIGVYDIGDPKICNNIIDKFDELMLLDDKDLESKELVRDKKILKDGSKRPLNHRSDSALFFLDNYWNDDVGELNGWLQTCLNLYMEKFAINSKIMSTCVKVHSVEPGGGYHIFHYEQSHGLENAVRFLTWMIYLNDLDEEDGGNTEFLYQGVKVQPKAGRCLIWPSGMTHQHRGNVAWKRKIYATGWFDCEANE